ncbi:hypothetical protein J5J10_00990 [Ciceribacter sp. L1K23]|uniref:hypothetical protein n=1 Tax=Ciceribacter sp. L1K23 TaxID=2820276 RepID=UPI001B834A68|nr:hypothetical protein [Ciceribacter sp. L1K23]MBR0554248.1 hypothetical protein [Ciceribacter sp. L1K23]
MSAFRFRQTIEESDADLLPPERRPSYPSRRFPTASDIVDAEFITVIEAPRRSFDARRFNDNRRSAKPETAGAGPVGSLASVERFLARLTPRDFATLVGAIFLFVFILAGMLATGSLGPAPRPVSLDLTHVSLTPRDADGMRLLQVNAIIENRADEMQAVPPVRADLVLDGSIVSSVVIHPPVTSLPGGHSRGLEAKLQHPGGKTPQLQLSFMDEAVAVF